MPQNGDGRESRFKRLIDIGIALSAERDYNRLLENILVEAKNFCNADGGTLYLMNEDGKSLSFAIMRNDTLGIAMGGTTGKPIPFPPVKMFDDEGTPNQNNVASLVALTGQTISIPDAYESKEFDFSGTRKFDTGTGYRSKSFLTVPLKNRGNEVIGVLQLINARTDENEVIIFTPDIEPLIEALASQAAVALDNRSLIDAQVKLFNSFIKVIATAIDAKSPYTGGHCLRVPELTKMLAKAACDETEGQYADFNLTHDEWYELEVAAGLHDCGKVTTPEYIVDKATKLETIYNRMHEIRTRFEVLKRDVVIRYLENRIKGEESEAELRERLDADLAQLDDDFAFVAECNVGGEFMAPDKVERLKKIGERTWVRTLDDEMGLSIAELRRYPKDRPKPPVTEFLLADREEHKIPHEIENALAVGMEEFTLKRPDLHLNLGEIYNLSIARGTLTNEDRYHINDHIVQTILMLRALPFPKTLKRVPDLAGNHHEKMDGTGYPRSKLKDDMTMPERIMAIADIFEALTAADRPYKPPKTLSESLKIMGFMCKDKHVDPDLFNLFLTSGVWKQYAERFLRPEQIDEVDINKYLFKPPPPPPPPQPAA
ncbi:MAG: GAF domain-containing protein [Alphaproteobacteria bacterium]|nr:GAF domain-containing protein [Alphaproteobacteria bacterium]